MIEKWRESLDQGSAYGALGKNLLKAFDCLLHELIKAKLYACGIDMLLLKFIAHVWNIFRRISGLHFGPLLV